MINSYLKTACGLLNAASPAELSEKYTEEDQKLVLAEKWDYKNPKLVVNKVKELLEAIEGKELNEDESYWRNVILWFWYHHAISCALWRYHDKESARLFSEKALEYQPEDHPNKITRLFYFLLNDQIVDAEQWTEAITTEPEKSSAHRLLTDYKSGRLPLPPNEDIVL